MGMPSIFLDQPTARGCLNIHGMGRVRHKLELE